MPDAIQLSVGFYSFAGHCTVTRYGDGFFGWDAVREYPRPELKFFFTLKGMWLTQMDTPMRSELIDFVSGAGWSFEGYRGFGGGFAGSYTSPQTAIMLGVGTGFAAGATPLSYTQEKPAFKVDTSW